MGLSLDLRQRIADAYAAQEGSQRELAERFAVSKNTVEKIVARVREVGHAAPRPHAGGPAPRLDAAHRATLRELVRAQPDATLDELITALAAAAGVRVSNPTMSRVLRALGLPRKKSRRTPPSSSAPTSSPRARPSPPTKPRSTRAT
jgi:transposase